MKRTVFLLVLAMFAFLLSAVPASATTPGATRIKVTTLDDLPRHTYEVPGTVTELVTSEAAFAPFAARVRANIGEIFDAYDIEDRTTLKSLYGTLLMLEMLDGNYDAALDLIAKIRDLEEKPSEKLMTGLTGESIIKARRETEGGDPAAYKEAFARHYAEAMNALPWEVAEDQVQERKGMAELFSKNLVLGVIQSKIEPAVEKTGQISGDIADRLIRYRYLIDITLPLKEERLAVLTTLIDAHTTIKADIWKERSAEFSASQGLSPVVLAIWDSGVDTELFPRQLFINADEKVNGKDDDGNGYVDDVHGIAYTLLEEKTTGMLYPMDDSLRQRLPEMKKYMKGLLDMQAAIDSDEASALKKKMSEMQPEEVRPFFEQVGLFGNYVHGTHVAGIAVEGNPFGRILVARITYDHRMIPEPPTVELAHKSAAGAKETADYFKTHGVRVVNMSWGGSPRDVEAALEANGIGEDAEQRAKMAREIFDISKEGLYEAIKGAPEILFVAAAGNSDNDISFDEMIPSCFDLPNILTVGAVDQAGDETDFTSFGEGVDVHANGFEVESYLPGGDRLAISGTSMASPNAVNLAGKLLAMDPSLNPAQVIALIKAGADESEDGRRILINPKRTVELLAARRQ